MSFWTNKIPTYGVILVAWAIFQCTSLLGVVTYGEMEFWLVDTSIFAQCTVSTNSLFRLLGSFFVFSAVS